jgi:hypothetical protein
MAYHVLVSILSKQELSYPHVSRSCIPNFSLRWGSLSIYEEIFLKDDKKQELTGNFNVLK